MALYESGRVTVYTNQVPYDTDVLRTNVYKMTETAAISATVLGVGVNYQTMVRGFPCVPVSPPGLAVVVGSNQTPDVMYSLQPLDATSYGSLPADTVSSNYQYKQGFNWGTVTLNTPAPVTSGNSVIHLVEVAFNTQDVNNISRPYFNSADPSMPIFNNNYDTRTDLAVIQLKTGIEAPTPTPPSPDAGFIGLYYVTVTFGQTSIISGNIQKVSTVEGQPFITESLTDKISSSGAVSPTQLIDQTFTFWSDIGTANSIILNPTPSYGTLSAGMQIQFVAANANTGATTATVNGQTHPIELTPTAPLVAGDILVGGIYSMIFSGSSWALLNPSSDINPQIVTSWNGSTTPVAVTAGTDISIASGVISFTGASSFVTPTQLQNQTYTYNSATGTNTYAVTIGGYSPLISGAAVQVEFPNANTNSSATLNINGSGAVPIASSRGLGIYNISPSEIAAGSTHTLVKYTSPDVWYLLDSNNPKCIYGETGISTPQSVTGPATVQISFDTAGPDPYSIFSTPSQATIPIAGRWRVNINLFTIGSAPIHLYQNGSDVKSLVNVNQSPVGSSYDINCNSGDILTAVLIVAVSNTAVINPGTTLQVQYLGPSDATPA